MPGAQRLRQPLCAGDCCGDCARAVACRRVCVSCSSAGSVAGKCFVKISLLRLALAGSSSLNVWAVVGLVTTAGIDFSEACNTHDRCYFTLGSDKAQCDRAFLDALLTECDRAVRWACQLAALAASWPAAALVCFAALLPLPSVLPSGACVCCSSSLVMAWLHWHWPNTCS